MNEIPIESFVQWPFVIYLRYEVFYRMDLAHVRNLYVPALPVNVVVTLVNNYTNNVVDYWTERVLRNTTVSTIRVIKHAVASGQLNAALLDALPLDVSGAQNSTWLKWALVKKPAAEAPCPTGNYTADLITATPASAFFGLQAWKVPCIQDWSVLSPQQAWHLLEDAAVAFTPSQFLSLSNASIAMIRSEVWAALAPAIYRDISAQQLRAAITPRLNVTASSHAYLFFDALSCDQIGQLKASQLVWLDFETQLKQFRSVRSSKCPDLPPLGLVDSVPAVLPPGYSQPSTSIGLWIGLAVTLVVVIIAVPVIIYIGKRIRAARQGDGYWPLQTNFDGEDEE